MDRWQFHVTSPELMPTDGNLSLPQTPKRQISKYLPPMPALGSPHDCAPLKPHRNESIVVNKWHKAPTRHRRRRSKSLDMMFMSAKEDSLPPKPQRIVSRRNVFAQGGGATNGGNHQPTRVRSLDLGMDIDVLMSPPCEKSRGGTLCKPSPSFVVSPCPAINNNHTRETKPNSRLNGNQNHRQSRSRSLDSMTLDFSFLNTPKCEKSRGPCEPSPPLIGSPSLNRFQSDTTPATVKRNNTMSLRRMRSRSLDVDPEPPKLPDRHTGEKLETDQNNIPRNSSNFERESMWIIPSFAELEQMKRISSLTMDDDDSLRHERTLVVDVAKKKRQIKRISSLTMEDDSSRRYQRTAITVLPEESDYHIDEETNQLPPTLPEKPAEERNNPERMKGESSSSLEEPTEIQHGPPPPPPPSSIKSKYTPPSPLTGPKWNCTNTKSNTTKPKLSPFASKVLGVS